MCAIAIVVANFSGILIMCAIVACKQNKPSSKDKAPNYADMSTQTESSATMTSTSPESRPPYNSSSLLRGHLNGEDTYLYIPADAEHFPAVANNSGKGTADQQPTPCSVSSIPRLRLKRSHSSDLSLNNGAYTLPRDNTTANELHIYAQPDNQSTFALVNSSM